MNERGSMSSDTAFYITAGLIAVLAIVLLAVIL